MICLRAISAGSVILVLSVWGALPAYASFIDEDVLCRQYGCVVAHDGVDYYVYDFYNSETEQIVSKGSRLIPRAGNPIIGGGVLEPVETGTLSPASSVSPGVGQGTMLDVTNGGEVDHAVSDDGNGFLDANDSLEAFELDAGSDIDAHSVQSRRSFFVTSTAPFEVSARLHLVNSIGSGQQTFYGSTKLKYGVKRRGTDVGFSYGRSGNGRFKKVGKFKTLSHLSGGPKIIAEFRSPIATRRANSLAEQSVRFDFAYEVFGNYDLSLGAGELDYQIEFDFHRP